MSIQSQEEFEKVRTALKAGKFADDPELQDELIRQAQDWKAGQVGNAKPPEIPEPQGGTIASSQNAAANLCGERRPWVPLPEGRFPVPR